MWEHSGDEAHLRTALALYRAGWERNPKMDEGYCGGNAAYLLDLLAYLYEGSARKAGVGAMEAEKLRSEAKSLREAMLVQIPTPEEAPEKPWLAATHAEIHFGLGNFAHAKEYLQQVRENERVHWKLETTATQLLNLARWQGAIQLSPRKDQLFCGGENAKGCREAIEALLGEESEAGIGRFRGKVGLALSGGGFRAAFFHLGVLARLAEIDALRHVEVLSTVSGGSIVGVHYYLELKRLLQERSDAAISREDYLAVIRRVQGDFLAGVQKNLRMRILKDFRINWKMLNPAYTRTHRIGDLYDEELYSRVADGAGATQSRTLPSLLIQPAGFESSEDFKPRERNWLRHAKVPELVLNTTSLNSGHNFQFTASWMGEPPGLTGESVDVNVRHRRLYYHEAPTAQCRNFPLGYAVAASSCVPGLFEPLLIEGLYPGRTVKLVDGGVHDNQGVAGLLDEGCDFILCSDASGQMHDEANPETGLLGVPLRCNNILMNRVRECEFDHLQSMYLSRRLKGLFFVHLKKDLAKEDIGWIGSEERVPASQSNQTPYGIDRDIQHRLSEIRTDLDSFSEVEAYSLMLSGYLMAEEHVQALNAEFKKDGGEGCTWGGFDVDAPREEWPFLQMEPIAAKPCDFSDLRRMDLEKQLAVGKELLLKAWRLLPWLRAVGWPVAAASVIGIFWLLWAYRSTPVSLGVIVIATLLIATPLIPKSKLVPGWIKGARDRVVKTAMALIGWGVANIHLTIFDPLFLKRGRLDRLMRLMRLRGEDGCD